MFKEYRLEIAVVMGLIATFMLYSGNSLFPVGYLAAGLNYYLYKEGK